ncbi:MAG: DNA-methyltransferase [Anaerorhabdus sp.]|uniref:DNA-methyltransferase n=1 Tax=Anaerorhabdus sp. TaxID=1872524 RepID=UPI003A8AFBC4
MNKINLINNDAFNELINIEDNSIDLILTDPPYNISKYTTENVYIGERRLNTKIAEWDYIEFNPQKLVKIFKRILKPNGNIFIFTSYNMLGMWHNFFDKEFDTFQFMVWHKTNPVPCIYKKTFVNSCELIICLWNKGHKWNFQSQEEMHNFIETPICSYPERLIAPKHPTQKPISVLKHIINIASNKGDVVLDPFMGVGSTGVAAIEVSRNFIGIEIDNTYFQAAKSRLL